jgi:putative DNA methylase
MTPIKTPKKLIEVALPLDAINAAAAREKSIRHGHPSTLHLWWARRPLAAARAVIFAQMVNDPGYQQGGGFKYGVNKEKAAIERERLFRIIEDLVKWENTNNEEVLERARAEIRRSWRETCELNKNHPQVAELFNPDKLPAFHDPFAGGGALPLEAQRLGLESYASDLNPVAVTINKAMIEIPPRFAGCAPVGPIPQGEKQVKLHDDWSGARGLAEDVRRYGAWMRAEAEKRIGHLYPKIEITAEMAWSAGVPPASGQDGRAPSTRASRPDLVPLIGQKLTVIAWLWARTVRSPNPAFSHAEVPLASTFILSSKKGKEAYVEPIVEGDSYRFTVKVGTPPEGAKGGTKAAGRGANFQCLLSGTPIGGDYIKTEGRSGRMGARLMAIVAEGVRGRVYLAPSAEHEVTARQAKPTWKPTGDVPARLTGGTCVPYGLREWGDLFTPRQLVALTTFSDLVQEAIEKCRNDYLGARASRPQKTWHTRGYLPHWEAGQIPQSITFRLHDSLPRQLLEQWQTELDSLPLDQQTLERRKRIEAALDQGYGECHLRRADIAGIVATALRHFDGERYQLIAWTIMPNHVHVLVIPLHGYSLSSILHSWKSFTAKEANRLLERTGAFWLEEYFDRAIRDEVHYARAVAYIENNPVKAGLCDSAAEWPWGSAWERGRPARRAARMAAPPGSRDAVPLDEGGSGARAYAEAVGVYLGFGVDKCSDYWSSICTWHNSGEKMRNTFGRQAIPMTWDFAEANPMCESSGNWMAMIDWSWKALAHTPANTPGLARQADAATLGARASGPQAGGTPALPALAGGTPALPVVSTDPPYYDNIGYADLSDFFYVWLRKSLKPIFPGLYATLAVPKAEELVATPYRHGSKEKAETFFLDGMTRAIHNLAEQAHPAFPVTIYYAFKQAETRGDEGTSSTGWETFLAAVLSAGFTLTGTWPMRTELGNRMIGAGTNALASSIVLVCRKRPADAPTVSRREFIRELNAALPDALDEMTRGGINSPVAPVDLSQAIIGPGMAIFSQYAAVLEADGTPMRVKTALQLINRFLAEDDFDHDTQFCLHWFEQQALYANSG